MNKIDCYCINLKRRLDRKNNMIKKINNICLNIKFIEAIDGNNPEIVKLYNNLYKEKSWYPGIITSPGAMGLILTWKKILKSNINKEKIIILEDDIYFHNNFNNLFNKINLNKDIIYLGANQNNMNKIVISKDKNYYEYQNEWIYGLFGVILNNKAINTILESLPETFNNKQMTLDTHINSLFKNKLLTTAIIYPNLIIPEVNNSDNMGPRDLIELAKSRFWNLSLYNII